MSGSKTREGCVGDLEVGVFDERGGVDEEAFRGFKAELERRFLESPEGQAWEGDALSWFVNYSVNYVGVLPSRVGRAELAEVLFGLIPRKVSIPPERAGETVEELCSFFRFAQRELGYERAAECLELLHEDAGQALEDALSDRSNWGMAKSFLMEGKARGYDMTTQAGIQRWVQDSNEGLERRPPHPGGAPAGPLPELDRSGPAARPADRAAQKRKRQAQKQAKRRNRKSR